MILEAIYTALLGVAISGHPQIIDGDTIKIDGKSIRLAGIDAPEKRQMCRTNGGALFDCGQVAKLALADVIAGQKIDCYLEDKQDRYGRYLGTCFREEQDINAYMVFNGYAMAYTKYSAEYAPQESAARFNKAGFWRGEFTNPAEYRKQKYNSNF